MSVRKVMVVDDEPAIGKLLSYQLQGYGYSVCYVQDGLQALERVLLEQPDLILLDVMMPLVSGWDVCRQIRDTSSVPIIMLTGKNADSDVVTGLQAGADDYVTKPFSVTQLQARIEAVLRRSAQRVQGVERRAPRADRGLVPEAPPAATALVEAEVRRAAHAPTVYARPAHPAPVAHEAPRPRAPEPQASTARLGQRLREARQRRGLTLYQAERGCQVRWEFLQAIEHENWGYLPRNQLRPAVLAYSGYLGIDAGEIGARLPTPAPLLGMPLAAVAALLVLLLVVGLTLL